MKECVRLKEEYMEIDSGEPLKAIEKRKNDFKTESEYISRIFNRDIKQEFVNQMKRELKNLVTGLVAKSGNPETFDQISATTVPGCDELNEKLDEKGVEGMAISQRIEKVLVTINKCREEVHKKVFVNEEDKRKEMDQFLVETIDLFFRKRIEGQKLVLPQFVALILNDLKFASIFVSVHFKPALASILERRRRDLFSKFVGEQENEIRSLLPAEEELNVKSIKKIRLFLSRLEKVLGPMMLKTDFINLQFLLINFSQKLAWGRICDLDDIGEEELEEFSKFCLEAAVVGQENSIFSSFLGAKMKLEAASRILLSSLVEIVNCYHRKEYKKAMIKSSELGGLVRAIFASSQLRNEFLKEVDFDSNSKTEFEDEDYF